MEESVRRKRHLSSFQIIALGFVGVIILGALLLMLPISSKARIATPFHEAIFTSTSAVCVTGLVVQDTASYWSGFGQAVILVMIQIGGMGVVTVASALAILSGKRISLMQRSTIQEAVAAPNVGGVVRLTGFIIKITFCVELLGAAIMAPVFFKSFGLRGIWMAVFHSISAFCNAGFDLTGTQEAPFASLTGFAGNPMINITVMLLIGIGGIGFLTWEDVRSHGLRLKKYRMQSKVILVTSGCLILIPTLFYYFAEYSTLSGSNRWLASLFQAVSPRTAGFNTTDLRALSGVGRTIMMCLMLVGGSPGSTAGGMKTTTLAVLLGNALAVFRKKDSPTFFGRSVEDKTVKNASTIFTMYLCLFLVGGSLISLLEGLPLSDCLFESISAVGTVGLTLGITPHLGILSQGILILLMFFGRLGGLTFIYAALSSEKKSFAKLPQEKIMVG